MTNWFVNKHSMHIRNGDSANNNNNINDNDNDIDDINIHINPHNTKQSSDRRSVALYSRPCIIFKKELSLPSESGQCGGNRSGESKRSAVTSIV